MIRSSFALAVALGAAAPAAAAPAHAAKAAPHVAKPPARPVETYAYLRAEGGAPARRVPLLSPRSASVPVARVDGTPIPLGELDDALAAAHEALPQGAHARGRDAGPILDRLVTLRLFVAEARVMGLDEQPSFKKARDEFAALQLRQFTEQRATRGVRPDPLEVERLYKDSIREWKLRSLLFAKKEDALSFRAAIASGQKFADLAKAALAKKQATGNEGADWVGRTKVLPAVAEAISHVDAAPACTDPIQVPGGWAVAEIEQLRYPDDPKARAAAVEASRERLRLARLEQYRAEIEKRWTHTDEKLWKSLDFEAKKPGFAALAKDRRVVVTIQGAKPVTVADVAEELEEHFFHGVEEPIKQKKVNAAKPEVLRKILTRRLFLRAAEVERIASSAAYRKAVSDYEDSLLFGAYVEKVIVPDVKVSEAEGKAYFEGHRAEFTLPAFYKLESLAFKKAADADAAMKKVAAGTDFGFLRANADGQVKRDDRVLALDGQTYSANTLPPELVQALAGAKRDEVRACATGGQFNLVRVIDATPPKEQSYLEARAAIGKKLAAEKLNQGVKDVAAKLRKAHRVAIFLERIGN